MKKFLNKAVPKTVGALLNASSIISSNYAAAKALSLFATPRKGLVNKYQENFLNTSKKIQLNYNGFAIMTYHWAGNNKTILLSHGWESNASRWKKLIELLKAKNYNIIALDAPAHGNSESKKFNAILYSEYINEVCKQFSPEIMIGHSVGGMASVFYQNKYHSENLKKMVLLGVPSEFKTILKSYTDLLNYNENVVKSLNKLIEETFGAPPSAFSTAKFAQNLYDVKGLIIHDKKDKIISYSDAQLIHNNFSGSKLISTSGFGHSLNNMEVYNHIMDFIHE
jgi:pimeloyl-ACP methyl ester carboxylesterase